MKSWGCRKDSTDVGLSSSAEPGFVRRHAGEIFPTLYPESLGRGEAADPDLNTIVHRSRVASRFDRDLSPSWVAQATRRTERKPASHGRRRPSHMLPFAIRY